MDKPYKKMYFVTSKHKVYRKKLKSIEFLYAIEVIISLKYIVIIIRCFT